MKIKIDRRKCTCWSAACETCFSWHYLGEEIRPNYCMIEVEDDGQPERTFYIEDRDGVDNGIRKLSVGRGVEGMGAGVGG